MFQIVIDNFVLLHEADINILEFDNSIKQNLILSSTQFFQFLILKNRGTCLQSDSKSDIFLFSAARWLRRSGTIHFNLRER